MAKVDIHGLPAGSRSRWLLQSGNGYNQICFVQVAEGDIVPVVNPSGESLAVRTLVGESVDVFIQDQTSSIINYRMHQDLEAVTLTTATAIDDSTVTLQAGHSAAAGQMLTLLSGTRFYQGIITNVAVDTLTLDTPLDYAFPITADAVLGNVDASVNGSAATPIVFHARPPAGVKWDIVQLIVQMIDDAAIDYTKFAGIAALTNGCVLRKIDGTYKNIGNVKRNGDFRLFGCDAEILTKVGGGEFAFDAVCQFGGQENAGVVIRLDGSTGDEIELLIRDDLTAISAIYVVIIGHIVED